MVLKKKICLITTVHNIFDNRVVYKIAASISKKGYQVFLLSSFSNEEEKAFTEKFKDIKLVKIPTAHNHFQRMSINVFKSIKLAKKINADVYQFCDPELIFAGLVLKFIFGKKVIYDIHEDVREQILNKDWIKIEFIKKVISMLYGIFEKISIWSFNKIICARPDIFEKIHGNNIILIRNFVRLDLFENIKAKKIDKNFKLILYSGGLSKIRGIKEIVDAMTYVNNRAELWLFGRWESDEYRNECMKSEGWEKSKYMGFLKLDELISYTKAADIGVINFYPVFNHMTSMPNKPFEYMACNIPMVMSDFKYWKKLFNKVALFADPYNPKSIAKCINKLINNDKLRESISEASLKEVKKYSWKNEERKLLNLYEDLFEYH